MIKENKVLKEVITNTLFCDDCGVEMKPQYRYQKSQCEYCKKDLCEACVGHEEDTGADYRIVYCKACWKIGDDYRPKIQLLHDQIDELVHEWQQKAKSKTN
jgi:hypothetical protein